MEGHLFEMEGHLFDREGHLFDRKGHLFWEGSQFCNKLLGDEILIMCTNPNQQNCIMEILKNVPTLFLLFQLFHFGVITSLELILFKKSNVTQNQFAKEKIIQATSKNLCASECSQHSKHDSCTSFNFLADMMNSNRLRGTCECGHLEWSEPKIQDNIISLMINVECSSEHSGIFSISLQYVKVPGSKESQWDVSTHSLVRSKSTKQQVDPLDYFICCRQTFIFFCLGWLGQKQISAYISQRCPHIYC